MKKEIRYGKENLEKARVSLNTREQILALAEKLGLTQSEVIQMAVDRLYVAEIINKNPASPCSR